MKIIRGEPKLPHGTQLGDVKFGSAFRIHKRPDYWPNYLLAARDITDYVWVLTSSYYQEQEFRGTNRQLQIMNAENGTVIGLNMRATVEVLENATLSLNEEN